VSPFLFEGVSFQHLSSRCERERQLKLCCCWLLQAFSFLFFVVVHSCIFCREIFETHSETTNDDPGGACVFLGTNCVLSGVQTFFFYTIDFVEIHSFVPCFIHSTRNSRVHVRVFSSSLAVSLSLSLSLSL
jgi:hypothetical protein